MFPLFYFLHRYALRLLGTHRRGRGVLGHYIAEPHPRQLLLNLRITLRLQLLQPLLALIVRVLVVVVVIPLVYQQKRYEVRAVKIPIAQPRPKSVITVKGRYLLVVGRRLERAADLLSS